MAFVFSFIWSAGGNLHDSTRSKFSQTIKNKILKLITGFPFEGDIFDYWANYKDKCFSNWSDLV